MKKKILSFFALVAYGIGSIAGILLSAWNGSFVTTICIAVLAAMAFPFARKCFKNLTEE